MHFFWIPIPWSWCFDVYSELCQLSFSAIAREPFISAFTSYAHLQSEEDSDWYLALYYLFIIAAATQSNWQPEVHGVGLHVSFHWFFGFFLSFKEVQLNLFHNSASMSGRKGERPFCSVYGLHSVAMKIMCNFLASVSWRPGSADFRVGTMPSEQMGINVSIGYRCYRHDSQFQMLQNVVLNFYLCM